MAKQHTSEERKRGRQTRPAEERQVKSRGGQKPRTKAASNGAQSPSMVSEDISSASRSQPAERFAKNAREEVENLEQVFDQFWQAVEKDGHVPAAKSVARANVEIAGLMSRRAKAYTELPAEMTHCQTPQDFWARQMQFMADMVMDYQATAGRIMQTIIQGTGQMSEAGLSGALPGTGGRSERHQSSR